MGVSIIRGAPFVQLQPESEISKSIGELVAALVPSLAGKEAATPEESGKRKRGLFGR